MKYKLVERYGQYEIKKFEEEEKSFEKDVAESKRDGGMEKAAVQAEALKFVEFSKDWTAQMEAEYLDLYIYFLDDNFEFFAEEAAEKFFRFVELRNLRRKFYKIKENRDNPPQN